MSVCARGQQLLLELKYGCQSCAERVESQKGSVSTLVFVVPIKEQLEEPATIGCFELVVA